MVSKVQSHQGSLRVILSPHYGDGFVAKSLISGLTPPTPVAAGKRTSYVHVKLRITANLSELTFSINTASFL